MRQPAVSVVVPVYNTEKYLRKCLDSLLNQTLTDIEIVAVDDGATDGSPAILDEYKEKYPDRMVVFHKENGGQATARNLAFEHCSGEFIGFLDSDDFVRPEMFQKMYEKAKETGADYVACGYTDVTYEGEKEIILKDYVASRVAKKTEDLFVGALASPFLHLYKRELVVDHDVKFPEGVIYEDTAFYLDLIPYITKIAVIEEPLAFRLRHSNSTMTTFLKKKVENIFPVLSYTLEFYQKNGFYEKYQKELEYFCVKVLLCSSMQRISQVKLWKEARELQKETLNYIREHFSSYRNNPMFQKGKVNLYMKCFNRITAPCVLLGMRFLNHFRRSYS